MEKVCLCKKCIFLFGKYIFKKGDYYKYRNEKSNDIWVVYDEFGGMGRS